MSILSPVTDNLLFLNQRKREIIPQKNVPDVGVDLGDAAYEADTLPNSDLVQFPCLDGDFPVVPLKECIFHNLLDLLECVVMWS